MRPRNTKNLKTTLSWIRLTNRSQRKARKRYRKNNALYTLIYNVLQGYQTSTVSFFTWIPLLWGSSRVTFFFRNAVSFRLKTITVPRLNHRRSAASRTLSLASSSKTNLGDCVRGEWANFTRLVLGCMEAKFCK